MTDKQTDRPQPEAIPFASIGERINDLRVTLSAIFTLAQSGPVTLKTQNSIAKAAEHSLERDTSRAAITHPETEQGTGAAAIACIRRLAQVNINNPGQRELAADDILATLQKIEAAEYAPSEGAVAWRWRREDVSDWSFHPTPKLPDWLVWSKHHIVEPLGSLASLPSASPSVREAAEAAVKWFDTKGFVPIGHEGAQLNIGPQMTKVFSDLRRALSSGEQEGALTTRTELNTTKGKV